MDIFDDFAAGLTSITDGLDYSGPTLDVLLQSFIDDTRLAIDSYLGMSTTLVINGFPVTMTVMDDDADREVATSLQLPLPALCDVEAGSVMIFYAANPGAFVDFAADTSYALNISLDSLALDQHLTPPHAAPAITGTLDLSHVNQAIGILIDQGHPPEQARPELRLLAGHGHTTVPTAARRLIQLNSVRHTPQVQPTKRRRLTLAPPSRRRRTRPPSTPPSAA